MNLLIIIVTRCLLLIISQILFKIVYRYKYINLLDIKKHDNILCKKYEYLKVKRVRRNFRGEQREISIDNDFANGKTSQNIVDDILVFGIKDHKEYLLFMKRWSLEDRDKIKNIVDDLNVKLKNCT